LSIEKKVKVRLLYSFLIDHSIGNKDVETSVPKFSGILPEFSGILPKFSKHQNLWGALTPPELLAPTPLLKTNYLSNSCNFLSNLDFYHFVVFLLFLTFPSFLRETAFLTNAYSHVEKTR